MEITSLPVTSWKISLFYLVNNQRGREIYFALFLYVMIAQLLTKLLRNIADRIDSGNSNMTDEELLSALETLEQYDTTARLSKDQSCSFLNISRSTFDALVRSGEIPRGKKIRGFKELFWTKSDLLKYESKRLEKMGNNSI